MENVRNHMKKICSAKALKRKVPIIDWLPQYTCSDLAGDLVAGLTVGLTVIPQGIAYALIAGLPPNYGLYSAFMGSFMYVVFGSCKDITIGPTAIMAFLTKEYAAPNHGPTNPDIVILLTFMSGLVILACGIFHLGFFISFISKPVIFGFTSAAAITICTSQLKGLFGIDAKSHGVVDTWTKLILHIEETKWKDLTLGLCCIIVLIFLKKLKDISYFLPNDNDSNRLKIVKKIIFLIGVGRNAIVVLLATTISILLNYDQPFTITGDIKPGLPKFEPPPFSTNNATTSFSEMMSLIGPGVAIIPLISVVESIAIASTFWKKSEALNASQEMLALGLCNVMGSFVQSMPTTGSFSRTAVNSTSGVRTQAGGIFTGIIVILALAVLTPFFKFIPISAMCAVIICAVISMVNYDKILPVYRVKKWDHIVLWVSFLACLFWKLENGIMLGILISVLHQLVGDANPDFDVEFFNEGTENVIPRVIIKPHRGFIFLNAEKIRVNISKAGLRQGQGVYPVVIDCSMFTMMDFTGSKSVQTLLTDFDKRGQIVLFVNVSQNVKRAILTLSEKAIFCDFNDLNQTLNDLGCFCLRSDCSRCNTEERNLIMSSDLRNRP